MMLHHTYPAHVCVYVVYRRKKDAEEKLNKYKESIKSLLDRKYEECKGYWHDLNLPPRCRALPECKRCSCEPA